MEDIDIIMKNLDQEHKQNRKRFLNRLRVNWLWFILFGFLGLAAGFLLSRYSQPSYQVATTLLVGEVSNVMTGEGFGENYAPRFESNIQNHMQMLKTYDLHKQVLENLNWRVSWLRKGVLHDLGMYRNEPYRVYAEENWTNLTGVPVFITPLSSDSYKVKVQGTGLFNGVEYPVDFEKVGYWGEPFENEFFHFIVKKDKQIVNGEEECYFVFNDLNSLAMQYLGRIKVEQAERTADVIRLTLEGSEPFREVDYLNELDRVYFQNRLQELNRASENAVRYIDGQLQGVVDSLQMAGRSFTDFRSKNRIVDLSQEAGMIMAKLEELETEQSTARMRLEYYRNLHRYLGDANQMKHVERNLQSSLGDDKRMNQVVAPSVVGITDPTLNSLVLKLSDLYSRREVLSYTVKEKNPSLSLLDQEIQHTRKSLEENLENLMSNSELEMKNLDSRLKKVNEQLASLPGTEQKLINIKRRFDLNNELYTFLLKKRAEAAITKASNLPGIQVLDPARVEMVSKVWPKTGFLLLVGLLLGFLFPFLVILFRHYGNDSIQDLEEVKKATRIPMIGLISHNHFDTEIPVMDFPRSGISESFRSLRTNLQYFMSKSDSKVIALHSSIPREGKSFASVNLASAMAMNNKKVLLVGADLRKSSLHQVFEVENTKGLSTFLIHSNSFDEVLLDTRISNLSLVPSGPLPPNPSELLGNGEFERFIHEAKERFDCIVLENAPVSMVTDGILTARFADANLFILRQGYTRRDQIENINQMVDQGILQDVALVLNDISSDGYYYDKNYYEEDVYISKWNRFFSRFRRN